MENEELKRAWINELMTVKARLKLSSYLLQKGIKIDEEELDELLERYKNLTKLLNIEDEG